MKKAILKTIWALLAIAAIVPIVSCSDNDEPEVKSYEVTVNITMPDGVDATSVEDLKLVTTKGSVNDTIKLQSASEKITLIQGQYSFSVSGKIKDDATAHRLCRRVCKPNRSACLADRISVASCIQSHLHYWRRNGLHG